MSEILAPAGGMDSLLAAINSGADAVYGGLAEFSARRNAKNFNSDELIQACKLCHESGMKFYLALNTLVFDDELRAVENALFIAAKAGVDAIIVQDFAVLSLVREMIPDMPVHASTQMGINSLEDVKTAEQLGFERVVLGRELSFDEIKFIRENTKLELEIFVHGALCVCVSGQCFFSAMLGGRSGNRGLCAQPCRLNFKAGNIENALSLKDNSLIPYLQKLQESGIESFKIEGRMKRPEYVAAAVSACRAAVCGESYEADVLAALFSRSGFTDGYFTGDYSQMRGVRTREDAEEAPDALKKAHLLYDKPFKRFAVDFHAVVKHNEMSVSARACGAFAEYNGIVPETARNREITPDYVCEQLSKLGGTQFFTGKFTSEIESGLSVSASALNAARRELIQSLTAEITAKNTPEYLCKSAENVVLAQRNSHKLQLRCEVATAEQLEQAFEIDFELIYAPMEILSEKALNKDKIVVIPPLFLAGIEEKTEMRLAKLKSFGFSRLLCGSLGGIELGKRLGYQLYGGFRLNITNSRALIFYQKLGVLDSVLSPELRLAATKRLEKPVPVGIIAYGRLPLMLLRRCPFMGAAACGKTFEHELIDRRGVAFPLACGSMTEVLNSEPIVLSDKLGELEALDFAVLKFTTEHDIKPIYDSYVKGKAPDASFTRGMYFRGVK